MNLEQVKNKKAAPEVMEEFELDFKPITSGLGFHHQKATEIKPIITEKTVAMSSVNSFQSPKKDMNVYQNDLAMFYNQGQGQINEMPMPELKVTEEVSFKLASGTHRVFAYLTDLLLVSSVLALVVTVMARTIRMDLMEIWSQYPNEITPLVMTLFCGFYLLYFSIFEKSGHSTLGKNLFGLKVMSIDNQAMSLVSLLARSTVSLLNFVSLGLFCYFDLQNKITSSKVVRKD
jgi:uncharacterized RDD family membrane protein YckC